MRKLNGLTMLPEGLIPLIAQMDVNIVNALAALASAVAAIASVVVAVRVSQRAESLAVAQQRQSAFATVAEWRRDLLAWATEAIAVLSEAAYRVELLDASTDAAALLRCRYELSSLIDRGRLFLPNVRPSEHGQNKPTAYRGYRHAALDPLVAAERVLTNGERGRFESPRAALIALKREFVSAIQRILDPERHNEEVARLIRDGNATRSSDPSLGGLVSGGGALPTGADAILYGHPRLSVQEGGGIQSDQS